MGSGGLKKIVKSVTKVASLGAAGSGGWGGKAVSALSGGLIGGPTTNMDALAKTQMAIANQQADQAAMEARAQADASAQAAVSEANRQAALQAAADATKLDTTQVDVATAGVDETASARRKRFNSTSVGASSAPQGPAIRI